jgi:hypothetical protein
MTLPMSAVPTLTGRVTSDYESGVEEVKRDTNPWAEYSKRDHT